MLEPDVIHVPHGFAHQDRGPPLRGFIIAMMNIAFLSVALRFGARLYSTFSGSGSRGMRLWWDDWCVLAALLASEITGALALDMIQFGFGKHITTIPYTDLIPLLKRLFALYFFYNAAFLFARASCLLFYARAFATPTASPWFKRALWVTHALNVVWFVGINLGTAFQCSPVKKVWNPLILGWCSSLSTTWLGGTIPSVLIDFVVLVLPLPMIWGLRIRVGPKIGLVSVFFVGSCVVVVSLGGLITIVKAQRRMDLDLTYEAIPSIYWPSGGETLAVISVNLPCLVGFGRRMLEERVPPRSSIQPSDPDVRDQSIVPTNAAYNEL